MSTHNTVSLKIDPMFKSLIRPLLSQEYLQLETNIITDGCRDPIVTWNGVIIDGHNRYAICSKYDIPFSIKEMQFECREAVIAWICANQLGRRNLTDETRRYLIGLQYENQKIANNKKNGQGKNQYTKQKDQKRGENKAEDLKPSRNQTAQRIAEANSISHATVEKYALYSRAVKTIEKKAPGLSAKILSGTYKMSHNSVLELAKLSKDALQRIERRLDHTDTGPTPYKRAKTEIQGTFMQKQPVSSPGPSVKDMPEYDPDSELTGLTLTIPSWRSSLSRVKDKTDIAASSANAKQKLTLELIHLKTCIEEMLSAIKESCHERL